jgi:hypothetical protein
LFIETVLNPNMLLFLLFATLLPCHHALAPTPTLGVVVDASQPSGLRAVSLPRLPEAPLPLLAWAGFRDTIAHDGWSYLAVSTNASHPDALQATAAGFVEGALTHQRIWEYASNHLSQYSWSEKLEDFIHTNDEWMKSQMDDPAAGQGAWWHQVSLVLDQQAGLMSGYRAHAPADHALSTKVLRTLSLHSDFDTLCELKGGCGPVGVAAVPPTAPNRIPDHCSVLVKLIAGNNDTTTTNTTTNNSSFPWSELYVAHTTWSGFEDMTRIYKMYDFPFSVAGEGTGEGTDEGTDEKISVVPGRRLAFSSYPGNLFSTDDWYTASSGLAVTETTIDNHNVTLWSHVVPKGTVLTWIRTQVANRLSHDGPSWASNFAQYNSGTYNNEFHVVDYNVFQQSRRVGRLLPHVLTVVDQMPGHVESADVTASLADQGFWGSYNRPGLLPAYLRMNYTKVVEEYGDHYSHARCSRAVLFRMLHRNVTDEASLQRFMRFNRFNDPSLPENVTHQMCQDGPSASNAISERGDLTKASSQCATDVARQNEAGIDCKYTTAAMMEDRHRLRTAAQSGPTYDDQPVFEWSTSPFASVPHVGQPDRWEFPWVAVGWD